MSSGEWQALEVKDKDVENVGFGRCRLTFVLSGRADGDWAKCFQDAGGRSRTGSTDYLETEPTIRVSSLEPGTITFDIPNGDMEDAVQFVYQKLAAANAAYEARIIPMRQRETERRRREQESFQQEDQDLKRRLQGL